MYRKNPTNPAELLKMAAERVSGWGELDATKPNLPQVQQLLEELEIHQIELERQNEHVNAARAQLELALSQSTELFDFCPFGSVMMNTEGDITKLNLEGARLLGQDRARLLGSRLEFYVAKEQRAEFNDLLKRTRSWREVQTCDLILQIDRNEPLLVHVSVNWFGDPAGWQIALVDMSYRQEMETQLRNSEERLTLALSAVGDGVWDWNVRDANVVLSNEFIELFGFSKDQLRCHVTELMVRVHPADKPLLMQKLQDCITGKIDHYANEHRVRCKDGSWKWLLARGLAVLRDKDGQALRVIGTMLDITRKKETEAALASASDFQQAVFDSLSSQIAVLDEFGTIVQTNAAWNNYVALVGNIHSVGQNYLALLPKLISKTQHVDQFVSVGMADVSAGLTPYFQAPEAAQSPCGAYWFTIKINPVRDTAHRMVVTHQDVSEIKRAELASLALANVDSLTGAFSRQHFLSLAELELSRSVRYELPLVALMLDLDHFKDVNDNYGHRAGDAVLTGFVQTVKLVLRESDVIGRIGGEEFAVLLPNTTQEGGLALAQRILAEVRSNAVDVDGKRIAYTVSIGAGYFSGQASFAALLAECDTALYRAKNSGRDRLEASWQNTADTVS